MFIFFILTAVAGSFSCGSADKVVPVPVALSFSPAETSAGGKVVITGSDFNTEMYSTLVSVGNKDISPDSVSSDRIVFTVPSGLTAGDYSLSVKTGSNISVLPGQLIISNMEITDPDVLSFNYAVGTQTIGPLSGFTSDDRLVESANAILSMGSNILKITFST